MRFRWAWIATALVLVLALLLAAKWPFGRQRIEERLGRALSSNVTSSRFRLIFFPHPGCVLEGVVVSRGAVQLATAKRLTLQGSWINVLTLRRRLGLMNADGLAVRLPWPVPPPVQRENSGTEPTATVAEARFDGAVLEVAGRRFEFRELQIGNLGWKERLTIRTFLHHPEPPGNLHLRGFLGPWSGPTTPVEGSYELSGADLGKYRGIAGTLASKGKVTGILGRTSVRGTASVEDFQVTSSGHSQDLQATFDATVDGMRGDVSLGAVEARFGKTVVHSQGTVVDKTATLDFESQEGRVEDLLYMFTKDDRPSMTGAVALNAHVVLPPEGGKFLGRLQMDGDFSIQQARFTKPSTQAKLNKLSGRARHDSKVEEEDSSGAPEEAVTNLRAHVAMREGLARLSRLEFRVAGAAASGAGTYNLLSKRVEMRGEVKMEATVSQAAGGFKAVILKPFNFLFRRKGSKAGAILPVRVTGTYPRPRFQVGLKPAD